MQNLLYFRRGPLRRAEVGVLGWKYQFKARLGKKVPKWHGAATLPVFASASFVILLLYKSYRVKVTVGMFMLKMTVGSLPDEVLMD